MGASCCGNVEDPMESGVQLPAPGVAGAEGPAAARAYLAALEGAVRAGLLKEEARARALIAAASIPEAAGRAGLVEQEELGRALLASVRIPENSGRTAVLACEETEWEQIRKAWATAREVRVIRKQMLRQRRQRSNAKCREWLAQQAAGAESAPVAVPSSTEVRLVVYRLGIGYHSAVEAYGKEYFFGGTYSADYADLDMSGIEICSPRRGPFGKFQEVIPMGLSPLPEPGITRTIAEMEPEWSIGAYHLIQRNCNNFAEALLARIGCPGRPPPWVNAAARCAVRVVPVALFNWVAREIGMQRRRCEPETQSCSCGARFGLCTRRDYCCACGRAYCNECVSDRRVVQLHGPHPVQVCRECAEPPPAPPPASAADGSAAAGCIGG
eukprot:TRINITY_DN8883_c0_g1_i4.p2 TRINITY_DN8883_c0_g1~~TRINITY_DN8883_c0_g1_i4.p2  ORF type:complete len:384 (+),score=87.33 TRINITY_DN8883_c0_g1_i4:96-1247(+)